MFKPQRFNLTLVVITASFLPTASALALAGNNHNETLLLDA
jgi:hypothetical protein